MKSNKLVELPAVGSSYGAVATIENNFLVIRIPLGELPTYSVKRMQLAGIACLTQRQRQVLDCLFAGSVNKEIARDLGVTVRTVKFHVSNLLQHFKVGSRTELLARARRQN